MLIREFRRYAETKQIPPTPEALNWNYGGSLYFALTIMTTIGACLSPSSPHGRHPSRHTCSHRCRRRLISPPNAIRPSASLLPQLSLPQLPLAPLPSLILPCPVHKPLSTPPCQSACGVQPHASLTLPRCQAHASGHSDAQTSTADTSSPIPPLRPGYGTFAPVSTAGRVMVVVFGIFGLAVSAICITVLSSGLDAGVGYMARRVSWLNALSKDGKVRTPRHIALHSFRPHPSTPHPRPVLGCGRGLDGQESQMAQHIEQRRQGANAPGVGLDASRSTISIRTRHPLRSRRHRSQFSQLLAAC
jgi:hypothetical protein